MERGVITTGRAENIGEKAGTQVKKNLNRKQTNENVYNKFVLISVYCSTFRAVAGFVVSSMRAHLHIRDHGLEQGPEQGFAL